MPNVLKVFLENGQTKSFKYDSSTTVGDVLDSLHLKLGIKCPDHFSLVVEHVKSLKRNKLTILDPKETLTRVSFISFIILVITFKKNFIFKLIFYISIKIDIIKKYIYLFC